LDKIILQGGARLEGTVHISGAKNAALPVIVSSLLTGGWNTFHNIPDLVDIKTVKRLLADFGVEFEGTEDLRVNAGNLKSFVAPYDLVKTMRASILVLGPLLARMGRARVSLPGGCAIGARPVNLHVKSPFRSSAPRSTSRTVTWKRRPRASKVPSYTLTSRPSRVRKT